MFLLDACAPLWSVFGHYLGEYVSEPRNLLTLGSLFCKHYLAVQVKLRIGKWHANFVQAFWPEKTVRRMLKLVVTG